MKLAPAIEVVKAGANEKSLPERGTGNSDYTGAAAQAFSSKASEAEGKGRRPGLGTRDPSGASFITVAGQRWLRTTLPLHIPVGTGPLCPQSFNCQQA